MNYCTGAQRKGDGEIALFRQSLACRLVTVVGKSCMKVKNNSVMRFPLGIYYEIEGDEVYV